MRGTNGHKTSVGTVEDRVNMAKTAALNGINSHLLAASLAASDNMTFVRNANLPLHGWFRYSAGYAASWVNHVASEAKRRGLKRLLDPFAGSATTLLEAEAVGIESVGVEAHPFVYRIARAKLQWYADPQDFRQLATDVLRTAEQYAPPDVSHVPELLIRCFPEDSLRHLLGLRDAIGHIRQPSPSRELVWLALTSILRESSPVGTANWQYLLPNRRKKTVSDPLDAFYEKTQEMYLDILSRQSFGITERAAIYEGDARLCTNVEDGWADLVITSPPYINNFDYADATRLEMTFLGEVQGWSDLHERVRQHLVCSCSQHVSKKEAKRDKEILSDPLLSVINDEIATTYEQLRVLSIERAGKKMYHSMMLRYFQDMANVFRALRRATSENAAVCLVIGDSAPYGIHIPVENWLGRLAMAAGFGAYTFDKVRERNTKWKNRKHSVPLHEGCLWIEG